MSRDSRRVEITTRTFLRALGVVTAVWLWFRLWQWVLVFLVGAFLAIALDPVVQWLEQRRLRRGFTAPAIVLSGVALFAVVLSFSGAALAEESRLLTARLEETQDAVLSQLPPEISSQLSGFAGTAAQLARLGSVLLGGLAALTVALVVAVYLLIDGRRTYKWLIAFVPERHRAAVEEVTDGARQVVVAFVRGNVITSVLAFFTTWVVLLLLEVPAALLLGVLAGVLDLVPIIGFFLSAAPAVMLATLVSPTVAIAVAAFFVLYNTVENYYITPKVYGRELRLSDLAVVAVFLVGAELGGVLGALVSLPIAAVYPYVEDAWLTRTGKRVAEEHHEIARQESDWRPLPTDD
jgi:predicted PurR-regulated permease PerM